MENNKVELWEIFEISAEGIEEGNPFMDISFGARFKNGSQVKEIEGFYDGEGIFKVRFMPEILGQWTYETYSNNPQLSGATGEFQCVSPSEGNHGPVRVNSTYHFAYDDGTSYYPVGTTCYAWTHQGDELEELTLKTLKASPFNKIRMCVFPKNLIYNSNEPHYYPFEGSLEKGWDFTRFNPEFFRHFEKRVGELKALGIEADIILFHPYDCGHWGFDRMGMEVNSRYLNYLLARLSSYRNVWWSMANEYDLMSSLTIEDWNRIIEIVADKDPYGHLRSIHNCGQFFNHNNPLLTHASIQNNDLKKTNVWREQYNKPVVIDECCYEGNIDLCWGNITEYEMSNRFWEGFLRGGYVGHGETYMHPQDILWWSKGGELHGKSPERIKFLRSIIEAIPRQYLSSITIEPSWENVACLGKEGECYFVYFGSYRPALKKLQLAKGCKYKVEVIDTWEMTITPLEGEFEADCVVPLPGKQYIALRIQKV